MLNIIFTLVPLKTARKYVLDRFSTFKDCTNLVAEVIYALDICLQFIYFINNNVVYQQTFSTNLGSLNCVFYGGGKHEEATLIISYCQRDYVGFVYAIIITDYIDAIHNSFLTIHFVD